MTTKEKDQPVLLAFQSFRYDTPQEVQGETHVGEIVFDTSVTIKEIKIIHNHGVPHDKVDFVG